MDLARHDRHRLVEHEPLLDRQLDLHRIDPMRDRSRHHGRLGEEDRVGPKHPLRAIRYHPQHRVHELVYSERMTAAVRALARGDVGAVVAHRVARLNETRTHPASTRANPSPRRRSVWPEPVCGNSVGVEVGGSVWSTAVVSGMVVLGTVVGGEVVDAAVVGVVVGATVVVVPN